MVQLPKKPKEFEEKIIEIKRVSKKTKGGNRIGFSVLVVIGNKKGKVGVGLGKAPDVLSAIKKGVRLAKRNLVSISFYQNTIPHEIYIKQGAAKVLLKPALQGTGVIAGGAIRSIVEVAGIHDIVTKQLGTRNKLSNTYATMTALKQLKLRQAPQKQHQKTKTQKTKK